MKTQMKNNVKPAGPDLESIISGLTRSPESKKQDTPSIQESTESKTEETEITNEDLSGMSGRLWDEFLETLNDPEEDSESIRSKKLYSIDDDIVETLHQCDFGKPNVQVINSILRTFLIDNIERLREMHRPRSVSLLDKY